MPCVSTVKHGDGRISGNETCDDNNTLGNDGCSANCLSNESCGNGTVDAAAGEVCDDSNTANGDGCSANCLSNEQCGNGYIDALEGEECGDNGNSNGDGCSSTGQIEGAGGSCGDSVIDPGEDCDDGNSTAGDNCDAQSTCDQVLEESPKPDVESLAFCANIEDLKEMRDPR